MIQRSMRSRTAPTWCGGIVTRACAFPAGPVFTATGDAALSFDPLSSQGLFNALYTGLAAALTADGYLSNAAGALADYARAIDDIRRAYSLAYSPTNNKLDGTYRKLKVQVTAPDGGPLKIKDQKGKDVKIDVVAREGYTAKHTVD